MTDVAGYHGGDGGDEPPHRHSYRVPTSCESSKPTKRRSSGKNLNLYDKFQKIGSIPLPIEFDYSSNLYRAVGENYQLLIRLISNEVDRHAPFHYRSWQEVPGDVKMSILTTLHVKEGGVPQHVECWRDMHFKGSSGWYNQLAEQHWENITDELKKEKSTSGGDDAPVDEVEVLERSLGQRRGHVRGVGRTVKSITPDLPPHMYAPAANELQQQQLAEANAHWAEQQCINEMMQQQINKLMSMQGGQGSSSFYHPGFETNQEKDQDQEEEEDEDESE
ncbi:hypothetical protein R6Q57_022714 [Mikania cordata]